MTEREKYSDHDPEESYEKLVNPDTPEAVRTELVRELFPQDRKEAMQQNASRDSRGRVVSYFRLMGPDELKKILSGGEIQAIDNPTVENRYNEQGKWILSHLQRVLDPTTPGFAELQGNFSYENAMQFLYGQLPRGELARLHKDGTLDNITGIFSTSIGAPMQDPSLRDIAVEMIIPDSEVLVYPTGIDNLPNEREIGLARIKKEWLVDAYFSETELEEGVIQNPIYPISGYCRKNEVTGQPTKSTAEALRDWVEAESMVDLLPTAKISELDADSPVGRLPLAA